MQKIKYIFLLSNFISLTAALEPRRIQQPIAEHLMITQQPQEIILKRIIEARLKELWELHSNLCSATCCGMGFSCFIKCNIYTHKIICSLGSAIWCLWSARIWYWRVWTQ